MDKALHLGYNPRNNVRLGVTERDMLHIVYQSNQVIHFDGDDLVLFDLTSHSQHQNTFLFKNFDDVAVHVHHFICALQSYPNAI